MLDCYVSKPPDDVKTSTLVNAWIDQTTNLINCNQRLKGLRDWKTQATKK